jgi:hypothetical protein
MLPRRKSAINLQFLNIYVECVHKTQFQVTSFSCFLKEGIWIIWQPQLYSLDSQTEKHVLFGNEHTAHPCHTLKAINIFIARTTDDQFLSTSLFFLNSCIICVMLKMASALYVISTLTWHHQQPLMTLRTASFCLLLPSSCKTQMSGSGMHFLWQGYLAFLGSP